MKKILLLLLFVPVTLSLSAQKQINDPHAQVRNVKSFHAISVSSGIELHLSQGSAEAVAVSASNDEYRDRIRTEVDNGVLKIYYDNDSWKSWKTHNKNVKAYVSFVKLDELKLSSGAEVLVEDIISSPRLEMRASSGSSFHGKVNIGSLDVEHNSGAVVEISGTVSTLKVDGSSGSVFKGYNLAVDNCEAETSSGSGIQITVNKVLSAHASSGGYVHYKGSGVINNIHTGSGGSVAKKS